MGDEGQEFSGKTVEEATEEGLSRLGLTAAQAEVEVISRGSRGIFGIGSEPARVRIARRAPSRQAGQHGDQAAPPVAESSATETVSQPETDSEQAESENTGAQMPSPSRAPGSRSSGTTPPTAPVAADSQTDTQTDLQTQPEPEPAATVTGALSSDSTAPAETAPVETTPVETDEELAALAQELLSELIRHMGFECTIAAAWRDPADDETERYLHLDIHGNDLGALIGRRGETLAGIQYLIRLMINQRIRQWKPIVVDVENYKERRNIQLTQLALRMAEQVVESGRAMSLEPMPPNERRIVHLALRDHPQVYTQSSGEGDRRKVHIVVQEE